MSDVDSASLGAVVTERATCVVCGAGTLQRGKRFFTTTDSILKCDGCKTEYHREKDRWVLRQVRANIWRWRQYEGHPLSEAEFARIAQGGQSDAEIASREEAERREEARRAEERRQQEAREAEEKRLRETPGTLQYYLAQYRRIVGWLEGQDHLTFSVQWTSASEARQHIKRFTQMQKELRQLKREVNGTLKEIRSSFRERKTNVQAVGLASLFGSDSESAAHSRAMQRMALREQEIQSIARYEPMLKAIDSILVTIDGLKVQIDAKLAEPRVDQEPAVEAPEEQQDRPSMKESKHDSGRPTQNVDEILNELCGLIGLDSVKHEFQEFVNLLKVQQMRRTRGMPTPPISLHVVFCGNPGTGKTTVARLLAGLYRALGFLGSGQLVETDRAGLVAGYVGQTALKVNAVVSKALGGVLFIDEAYALASHAAEDYGAEAVEAILKQMEDHREELAVIVAGYPDKMEEFLASNPGVRSRFGRVWHFDDYTPPQLAAIFDAFCAKDGFCLNDAARQKLIAIFQTAYDHRDQTFGNARLARNLFEAAISNQANRVVHVQNPSKEMLSVIDAGDLDSV